jgi:uncharacterized protein with FMN-binding domain
MRRVILTVAGTVAGLIALLTFRSHVPSSTASASTGTAGSTGSGSASGTSNGAGGGPIINAKVTAGERAIDGKAANTAYGPVQVQVLVKNTKIVNVNILVQPQSTVHDLQIGQMAFPQLVSETIKAQSGRIDSVSGATYTSGGYIKSLQSAIDNGA